jgi:hypothetical protein
MNCEYVESGDFSVWKISPWTELKSMGVQITLRKKMY